jgi:hypothetical protein
MDRENLQSKLVPLANLFTSFSPASRAALLFSLPFAALDALHYLTAGSALVLSLPLVMLFYLGCGALAAKLALNQGQDFSRLAREGLSAGLRLFLLSTAINLVAGVLLGVASLGATLAGGLVYLCLVGPVHAIGSLLLGWAGAWLYGQIARRSGDRQVEIRE